MDALSNYVCRKYFINSILCIHIKKIDWLKRFLAVLKYFSLVALFILLIDYLFFNYAFNRFYNYPIYIGMAAITYWLGIVGFQKRNISVIKESMIIEDSELKNLDLLSQKLSDIMSDKKLYKNPNLNLVFLADELNVKQHQLSKCINLLFEKNFNDYINSLRIEELKTLLEKEESKKFTLLSLAFEVGFNSKASFNRAVKKLTGKPPSKLKT